MLAFAIYTRYHILTFKKVNFVKTTNWVVTGDFLYFNFCEKNLLNSFVREWKGNFYLSCVANKKCSASFQVMNNNKTKVLIKSCY